MSKKATVAHEERPAGQYATPFVEDAVLEKKWVGVLISHEEEWTGLMGSQDFAESGCSSHPTFVYHGKPSSMTAVGVCGLAEIITLLRQYILNCMFSTNHQWKWPKYWPNNFNEKTSTETSKQGALFSNNTNRAEDFHSIGNAKEAGMADALHLSSSDYSLAVSIFFIGYLLLEVPSNMILSRTRPSLYLPGLMVSLSFLGWVGQQVLKVSIN